MDSSGGYKWLKYVPNGLLKTAQAAEWKVQAWMLGKPPTIAFEGIGFDVKSPRSWDTTPTESPGFTLPLQAVSLAEEPRPSMSSAIFSEYDDLRDFDGRFESRSTLDGNIKSPPPAMRKPSRGFLGRLKGKQSQSQLQTSPGDVHVLGSGKKLKALRSMGSLKSKAKLPQPKMSDPPVPSAPFVLPLTPQPARTVPLLTEFGLGLDDLDWTDPSLIGSRSATPDLGPLRSDKALPQIDLYVDTTSPPLGSRVSGRRSISSPSSPASFLPSPAPSPSPSGERTPTPAASFQAALGNALIAASHAESSKGTHGDLLLILNHERQPWGFSYTTYPHDVCIWYGDKDEKITESAMRWMENTMGTEKCQVKIIPNADHALLYKSAVVIEVLERISGHWRDCGYQNSSLRSFLPL